MLKLVMIGKEFCASMIVVGGTYLLYLIFMGWKMTREAPKEGFYTCDKHGPFPSRILMSMPVPDGGEPVKVCPFCYDEAFKIADQRLRAEEDKRGQQEDRKVQ